MPPEPQPGEAVFRVVMDRCPHALCRVLGLVAQRSLAIDRLDMVTVADGQRLTLVLSAVTPGSADLLAERMRAVISVASVAFAAG